MNSLLSIANENAITKILTATIKLCNYHIGNVKLSDWLIFLNKYNQTCPCGNLYLAVTCIKRSPFSCPVIEYCI
jgi:hypothetical protein